MESEVLLHCQWRDCETKAAKHLVFGLRVFDAPENIHISDASYTPTHMDLCVKHIEIVSLQYVHATEFELGTCPEHHHSAAASPETPAP